VYAGSGLCSTSGSILTNILSEEREKAVLEAERDIELKVSSGSGECLMWI